MSLIQRVDVVQQFSTATSDSSFRNSVLPRCLDARSLRLQTGRCQQLDYIDIEFRIVVEDHVGENRLQASFTPQFVHFL
jgi:hypothetical protein